MTSMTTPFESNVGDRFNPTNEELINYFLKHKLLGNDHLVRRILVLDLYKCDPWDLPWTNSNDREGYFFSPLHAKYSCTNNRRINRSTRTGSWLAKGKDYEITSQHNEEVIGIRKIFVHSCIKDGIKYVMHEYSIPDQSALVLCKVMKKTPSNKSEGTSKKVKKRKEEDELPLPCNKDNSTLASDVMKKKMPDKKIERPCKKVKKTEEKAEMPYNKDNSTPVTDEGSDFENWITSDQSDLSTYNNIINNKDQQTEKLTCDNGGTNCLKASAASVHHVADFTIPKDLEDPEILPHLQSFRGYDQQDYSLDDFTLDDQPLKLREQVHANNGPAGTPMSILEEDTFNGLEPLWD